MRLQGCDYLCNPLPDLGRCGGCQVYSLYLALLYVPYSLTTYSSFAILTIRRLPA